MITVEGGVEGRQLTDGLTHPTGTGTAAVMASSSPSSRSCCRYYERSPSQCLLQQLSDSFQRGVD